VINRRFGANMARFRMYKIFVFFAAQAIDSRKGSSPGPFLIILAAPGNYGGMPFFVAEGRRNGLENVAICC
jgi:hypothetical protein